MKKLLSSALALGILSTTSLTPAVFADVASTALPSLNSATNADVTTSGSNMNVQITAGQGGVGTLNWNSYNIGSDASVNYEFTAHNQTALNKVAASGGLSQIYGSITASGCSGCDYAGTGKVILINPNGILFGDGANVNLNSFTATTFDGTYDEESNTLSLTRSSDSGDITVLGGATIYGDKNVTLAASNITTYAGSKITTNVAPNVDSDSYGKVKLVTADGVNFTYYNNGAVKSLSDIQGSADKMVITLNGEIEAGNIDIRNYSTDSNSQINLKGAVLKATKAVSGNDGNIWLTAANDIIIEDSTLETVNYSAEASSVSGGNVRLLAGNKVSVGTTDIDSVGNVIITSQADDIAFDASTIDAAKDVTLTAANVASVQNGSTINAEGDVTITGTTRGQVLDSNITSNGDIVVEGGNVWFRDANLEAANNISATATTGWLLAQNDNSLKAGGSNTLTAATNVTTSGTLNLNNSQTNIYAGNNIDVYLEGVESRANGLVAEAENDVTIETPGTLSVSRLVSKNGDMTLTADNVIAGLPYTDETKLSDDTTSNRSYIEVLNGTFTSNTANDSYTITASGDPVDVSEGYYNTRHHIEYGNGDEKILLVTKLPYTPSSDTPSSDTPAADTPASSAVVTTASYDGDQATMLNKLPRQPEVFNNTTNITDGRTTFVDVFAAASQIEIVDDEE